METETETLASLRELGDDRREKWGELAYFRDKSSSLKSSLGILLFLGSMALESELGSAFAAPILDSALAGGGFHAGKEAVLSGSLALFGLVCCRHFSKQVINTL